ncbi:hypothetical protein EYF80_010161 [Liparis tanakae]|uniref:Uncharacterized protein n=1 Tax=Liparis tanakae TaxID=230148 RepID=A0A4Z2INH7_9TELE|nr:hypothetical protein EYF80_010161 [Liparis tanakae]
MCRETHGTRDKDFKIKQETMKEKPKTFGIHLLWLRVERPLKRHSNNNNVQQLKAIEFRAHWVASSTFVLRRSPPYCEAGKEVSIQTTEKNQPRRASCPVGMKRLPFVLAAVR